MPYRMKHLPTGLYYMPSREVRAPGWKIGYVKSNLSDKGKVYLTRPSLAWIGRLLYSHVAVAPPPAAPSRQDRPRTATVPFVEAEWAIEEI